MLGIRRSRDTYILRREWVDWAGHVSPMGLEHPLIVEIWCVWLVCRWVFLDALETLFFNNLEISPFVSMCMRQLRLHSLLCFLAIGHSVVKRSAEN